MLLSACIVTRDKSNSISRTIKSVKNIADEVILVDLDSLDNTRTIAREAGARVIHLKGQADIHKGRNIAREKVRGQWLLFLDGDEELGDDYRQLRIVLRNSEVDGFYLPVLDFRKNPFQGKRKGESLLLPRLSFRLYKNNRAYFYSNDKHESITNSILNLNGEASLKILHLPIVKRANTLFFAEDFLINFGLEEEEEYHEQKIALLVKKALEEEREGYYELALERLEEAYYLAEGQDRKLVLKTLLILLIEDRQYQRIERIIKTGLLTNPGNLILIFWEGYLAFIKGKYEEAQKSFEKIIFEHLRNNKIESSLLAHSYLFLGLIFISRNKNEAKRYLDKAFSYEQENRITINSLLEVMDLSFENLNTYFQLENPENKNILLLILETLFMKKRYPIIEEIINNQRIFREDENIILYWQGLVLFKKKQYNLARKKLRKIRPDFIYYRQALHLQWLLNLLLPGSPESRSIANQLKLMGDYIDWNLVLYINRIYFYRERVLISFENAITGLRFYIRLLYFLDLFIEFSFQEGITILQEILKSLHLPGTNSNLGILFYFHGYRNQAAEYLQRALKEGPALTELNFLEDLNRKMGENTEETEWSEKSEYLLLPGEITLFCRNSSLFVE